MYYRTIVQDISNDLILADGKWLKKIGNISVGKGDYVFTDGKVIFGNHSVYGGGSVIIVDGSIPYVIGRRMGGDLL